jgi:mannosyltransferase
MGAGRIARWTRRPFVPPLAVGVVAVAVYASWVARPGVWRDEAVTLAVCRRSVHQIVDLIRTENADLVHLVYYLLVHMVMTVNDSMAAVRLLSVVAFALTAVMLVLIGRRLGSVALGTLAGLILVICPLASRYAQEARPAALTTLAVTVSTYVLLGAIGEPGRRRRWLLYGLTVLMVTLVNVLALLVLLVHAILVLVAVNRLGRVAGQDARLVALGWLTSVLMACTVAAPFLVATYGQRDQVSWLEVPQLGELSNFFVLEFASAAVLVAGITAGIVVLLVYRGLPAGPEGTALVLGVCWAVLPPVVLWGVSQVHPLWDLHYVVFTLPGTALALSSVTLLLGRRLAQVRRLPVLQAVMAAITLILLTGLSWQAQVGYRQPLREPETEDVFAVGAYLADHAKPGDGVLFLPGHLRVLAQEDATNFPALRDLALESSALDSATMTGWESEPADIAERVGQMNQIWLVADAFPAEPAGPEDEAKIKALAAGFRRVQSAEVTTLHVDLWVRATPGR